MTTVQRFFMDGIGWKGRTLHCSLLVLSPDDRHKYPSTTKTTRQSSPAGQLLKPERSCGRGVEAGERAAQDVVGLGWNTLTGEEGRGEKELAL